MLLNKINTLGELAPYVPLLIDLFKKLDGKWESDLTEEQFFQTLLHNFTDQNWFFGAIKDNSLVGFAVIIVDKPRSFFWLFYMSPDYREETKDFLGQLKQYGKANGISQVRLSTTRTQPSYERWLRKFGATKHEIVYNIDL